METAIETTETKLKNQPAIGDFGAGRYSGLQNEIFSDAQRLFGLDEVQADKLSRYMGRELGAIFAGSTVGYDSFKLSKINKDGKMTITEAASKIKGATFSYAVAFLQTLAWANQAVKVGCEIGSVSFTLSEQYKEMLKKVTK